MTMQGVGRGRGSRGVRTAPPFYAGSSAFGHVNINWERNIFARPWQYFNICIHLFTAKIHFTTLLYWA